MTHFGIDPLLLPRGNLRFDTFHMKCAVVRRILTCIRSFVLNHSVDVGTKFDKNVLSHFGMTTTFSVGTTKVIFHHSKETT